MIVTEYLFVTLRSSHQSIEGCRCVTLEAEMLSRKDSECFPEFIYVGLMVQDYNTPSRK